MGPSDVRHVSPRTAGEFQVWYASNAIASFAPGVDLSLAAIS
jgi:hypothetical protein